MEHKKKLTAGIYQIKSPSGGKYIGSAADVAARWRSHRHLLRHGRHHSPSLQRASKKYGIDGLTFSTLIVCRRDDLAFFEQRAIDTLKPTYNIRLDARGNGVRRTNPEARAKQAASMRGKKIHTVEHKAALARRMTGNKIMVGRKATEATLAKLSKIARERGLERAFERTASPEQRRQMATDYLDGMNLLVVAGKNGIDHRTARRMLLAEGVAIRPRYVTIRSQNGS